MEGEDQHGPFIHSRSGRKVYQRRCPQCQLDFFPIRTDQRYCRESCRVMAYRQRVAAKQPALPDEGRPGKRDRKAGDLGSLTGVEIGDLALGVVVGNVLTGVGKSLLGVKSSEQKTLDRIEQKLETLTQPPVKSRPKVSFTGHSTHARLTNGSILTLVEVLLNQKTHYLDNLGRLFVKEGNGFRLVSVKGRDVLGLQ